MIKGSLKKIHFKGRFKQGESVNVSELGWERVPEPGSRVAENSTPHGGEVVRRDREDRRVRKGVVIWRRADSYRGARL